MLVTVDNRLKLGADVDSELILAYFAVVILDEA
jgi:hypothetical protein